MIWWLLWYGALALLMLPFLAFALAFARTAAGAVSHPLDKAFAFTSVSWFGLMGAALVSGLLWTAASRNPGVWSYLRNGGIVAVVSILLGLLVGFPATMYVASHTYPMKSRRSALFITLLVASGFLVFCLWGTWQYRQR